MQFPGYWTRYNRCMIDNRVNILSRLRNQKPLVRSALLPDLFEHLPVVVFLADHHHLQLLRVEDVHHLRVAHLEKAPLELLKRSLHRLVESVVDAGGDILRPVKKQVSANATAFKKKKRSSC